MDTLIFRIIGEKWMKGKAKKVEKKLKYQTEMNLGFSKS